MNDVVNHPQHYKSEHGLETIDVIEKMHGKFDHRDQVTKYNTRAHKKGNFIQDLEKARWYLDRTIQNYRDGKIELESPTPEPEQNTPARLDKRKIYEDIDGDYWAWCADNEQWRWFNVTGTALSAGYPEDIMQAFNASFFQQITNTYLLRYLTDLFQYLIAQEEVA